MQRMHPMVRQLRMVGEIEDLELDAIEAGQATEGPQPEVAVSGLSDAGYGLLRQKPLSVVQAR